MTMRHLLMFILRAQTLPDCFVISDDIFMVTKEKHFFCLDKIYIQPSLIYLVKIYVNL